MNKNNISQFDERPPKNTKPRVLVDLDGVVRDFIGSLIHVYNGIYPDHSILPVTSRRLEDFFPIGEKIYQFMKTGYMEQIMEEALAYPGALEALELWQNEFEIVIVTAQPDDIRSYTYNWIGKNKIASNEVHISYYKSQIDGIALLDDFIDNLEEFAGTDRLAVCLDQPWNQDWNGPRVKTVDEFFKYVQIQRYNQQRNIIDDTKLT
jgi:5'(3')-deoxyribonucleotidase